MPSSTVSGAQAATLGTTHTIVTTTTAGTFVLVVDTSALVVGETLTLEVSARCRAGDTLRVAYSALFQHTQGAPLKISPPVVSLHELVATLKQEGGTGRTFPWNLVRLDA